VEFAPPKAAGVCDNCGTALTQRPDDMPDKIRTRLTKYHQETSPVIGYYEGKKLLRRVDGVGAQDAVFDRLAKAVDLG
jgi:adenylate kinase